MRTSYFHCLRHSNIYPHITFQQTLPFPHLKHTSTVSVKQQVVQLRSIILIIKIALNRIFLKTSSPIYLNKNSNKNSCLFIL